MAIVDSFGRLLASCDRAEVGGNKEKRTTAVAKKDLSEDRAVMMKYLWRLVSDVQSGICHIVFGWCGRPSSITCQRPIDLFLSNYRPLSSIQPSPLSQSKWLFRSSPSPPSPFDPSYFCSSSLHPPAGILEDGSQMKLRYSVYDGISSLQCSFARNCRQGCSPLRWIVLRQSRLLKEYIHCCKNEWIA